MINMDEEEIVKLFLENGFQISKSALKLVPEDPKRIIPDLKKTKPRPFIITEQHIKKILMETKNKPANTERKGADDFRKTVVCVGDYVNRLSARYEKNKSSLLKQMPSKKLISINKITPRTMIFSIIGLVRKKNDDSILIEDPTGETSLYFDGGIKNELKETSLDDVIGVQCKKIREKFFIKKVFCCQKSPLD